MRGDLFIRQTLHHHLQHFPLPQGEVFYGSVGDGACVFHRVVGFFAGMSEQALAHKIGEIAREREQSGGGAVGGCGLLGSGCVTQKDGLHSAGKSGRCADKICFVSQQDDGNFESDQFFPICLR